MLAPFKQSLLLSASQCRVMRNDLLSPWVWLVVTGVLDRQLCLTVGTTFDLLPSLVHRQPWHHYKVEDHHKFQQPRHPKEY